MPLWFIYLYTGCLHQCRELIGNSKALQEEAEEKVISSAAAARESVAGVLFRQSSKQKRKEVSGAPAPPSLSLTTQRTHTLSSHARHPGPHIECVHTQHSQCD